MNAKAKASKGYRKRKGLDNKKSKFPNARGGKFKTKIGGRTVLRDECE